MPVLAAPSIICRRKDEVHQSGKAQSLPELICQGTLFHPPGRPAVLILVQPWQFCHGSVTAQKHFIAPYPLPGYPTVSQFGVGLTPVIAGTPSLPGVQPRSGNLPLLQTSMWHTNALLFANQLRNRAVFFFASLPGHPQARNFFLEPHKHHFFRRFLLRERAVHELHKRRHQLKALGQFLRQFG